MITILGTNASETIRGSGFDEDIFGFGGDDLIFASSGHDNIRASNGNDTVYAGNGFDFVSGGEGDDTIYADGGNDTVLGGAGDDTIYGGQGTDLLYGNTGNDTIYTGSGPDQSWGGDGDDTIIDDFTNGGTEVMYGGAGNDRLLGYGTVALGPWGERTYYEMYGEAGDDHLTSQAVYGAILDGGEGNDLIEIGGHGGTAIGGTGNDKLYSALRSNIFDIANFERESPGGRVTLDGGLGNDSVYAYDYSADTVLFRQGDGRDTVFNFNTDDDYAPRDMIDLTDFGFGMTAQEVLDRYAVERDGRTILRFDADSSLVLVGVTAAELVDSLII